MVENTKLIAFSPYVDEEYGTLVPIEEMGDIPFSLQRVYYIYDVPQGVRRGFHSHIDLQQVLVCVKGSVKILVKTPFEEEDILLNSPAQGLYVGPFVWREMYDFSEDAVLLVMASKLYAPEDYIRDYAHYEKLARDYFLHK